MSQVIPELLWIFGPGTLVVPFGRTFPVVPGLFGIFRLGTLVVMFCGSPRTGIYFAYFVSLVYINHTVYLAFSAILLLLTRTYRAHYPAC